MSKLSPACIAVGEWLKTAVAQLHGVSDSPQLDAEILLHAVTGMHRARAYARPEELLTREQLEDLQVVLARRQRGEPIAYITRVQEFWSMPLVVSPAVLIPRPETELLVERALELVPLNQPSRVLDMGTGSGAIALAIACARPHAQVLAIDVSDAALAIAATNLTNLKVRNLELRRSDWYSAVVGERFDLIVSNPPYVAADDPALAPSVAAFEPRHAVIAGESGLEAIERIVSQAAGHLLPQGCLALEHGWKQGTEVRGLLVRAGFSRVRSHRDLAGHDRVTEGHR
ncbi:MAG: peptide chain release factor N(5)-glutamine methyltransferase [Candidatus Obscuribacterales bacterium]|nr:peptide chain release factor N(5)-glutamine methyltransferase [Steroidobacteraceae bacterium]